MTKELKLRLVSALNTFVSTFLVTLGSLLIAVDLENLDKATLISLLISAVNVGFRMVLKEFTSGLTK